MPSIHGFFVILDVAMGGGFPAAFGGGPTASTVSGVPMVVDYVAAYTSGDTSATTTTAPTTTTPTGTRSAYTTLEAESFSSQSGIQTEATTDVGGGQDIGFIANGGWQSWRTVPASISEVTGVHEVFLTFASGQPADFVNVNWFTFGH